jgi:hypothetical protein
VTRIEAAKGDCRLRQQQTVSSCQVVSTCCGDITRLSSIWGDAVASTLIVYRCFGDGESKHYQNARRGIPEDGSLQELNPEPVLNGQPQRRSARSESLSAFGEYFVTFRDSASIRPVPVSFLIRSSSPFIRLPMDAIY